jgi:hypothetical protein
LLDAYVAAHQDDLVRDVARYGDPRKLPGFDPQQAREDRAQRIQRLNYQGYQDRAIDDLREQLDQLKALAAKEPPESPRLNKALRKVLDDYSEFAKRAAEDLTAEVKAWLREVESFRDAHAEALRPKASQDARINARLAAIGPYKVSYDRETPSISWSKPAGLDCDWTDISLMFSTILEKRPDPSRVNSALDALCDEWDRLRARWPELLPELRLYVLDLFRNVIAENLPEDESPAYQDDDGAWSEEKILGAIEGGTIVLTRHFDDPVLTEIYFSAAWEEEHGVEVQFDEDGEILRWF